MLDNAWGLTVWTRELPDAEVAASLACYDAFYDRVDSQLRRMVALYGSAVVLDVHSYNHRRGGPDAGADDPSANPEVNIGTGSMDRERWGSLVERVVSDFGTRGLEVRENVRFRGGHFAAWAHERFGGDVCVLAIEFKKVFMDEWTGVADPGRIEALRTALAACLPGIRAEREAAG